MTSVRSSIASIQGMPGGMDLSSQAGTFSLMGKIEKFKHNLYQFDRQITPCFRQGLDKIMTE